MNKILNIVTIVFFTILSSHVSGQIPSELTYQDFDSVKKAPMFYDAWQSNPIITKAPKIIKNIGEKCLKIKATANSEGKKGGTVGIYPQKSFTEDIKHYYITSKTVISAKILDTVNQHIFECKIFDVVGNIYVVWSEEKSKKDKWQRVFWNLKDFSEQGLDPSKIWKIEIYVPENGVYYFDNFRLFELNGDRGKTFEVII